MKSFSRFLTEVTVFNQKENYKPLKNGQTIRVYAGFKDKEEVYDIIAKKQPIDKIVYLELNDTDHKNWTRIPRFEMHRPTIILELHVKVDDLYCFDTKKLKDYIAGQHAERTRRRNGKKPKITNDLGAADDFSPHKPNKKLGFDDLDDFVSKWLRFMSALGFFEQRKKIMKNLGITPKEDIDPKSEVEESLTNEIKDMKTDRILLNLFLLHSLFWNKNYKEFDKVETHHPCFKYKGTIGKSIHGIWILNYEKDKLGAFERMRNTKEFLKNFYKNIQSK